MTAAAISACFSDYRLVKTRSVISLIFEVPIERQAEVFAILGFPMPGQEIHCGIARLQPVEPASRHSPAAAERPGSEATPPPSAGANLSAASLRGKERYANSTAREQAVVRAARLSKDERFRAWVAQRRWNGRNGDLASENTCIEHIREVCCEGGSRSLIGEDAACYERFMVMETAFKIDVGELASPR